MKLGDEMGGHIVTGHVDGVAEVIEVRGEGDSKRVAIRLPRDLAPFVAAKGSITLDGVSLPVHEVADERDRHRLTITIIPHHQALTPLGAPAPARPVHLEIDVPARRAILPRSSPQRARSRSTACR